VSLTAAINRPDLSADSRFTTADNRIKNYAQLYEELKRTFAEKPLEEWLPILEQADVPHEPVLTVDQALSSEKSSNPIWAAEHPVYGTVRTVAPAIEMSETPLKNTLPPPGPGEHSEQILAEYGFSAEEIRDLSAAGVLGFTAAKRDGAPGKAKSAASRAVAGEG
jgi:crotonobetainyl-CoA:carnitine CoA-transferase CaiB-like acyl-CoA transferase